MRVIESVLNFRGLYLHFIFQCSHFSTHHTFALILKTWLSWDWSRFFSFRPIRNSMSFDHWWKNFFYQPSFVQGLHSGVCDSSLIVQLCDMNSATDHHLWNVVSIIQLEHFWIRNLHGDGPCASTAWPV
jgi:hypothetical protein